MIFRTTKEIQIMLREIVIPLINRVRPVPRTITTKVNVLRKMVSVYKYQTFLRKGSIPPRFAGQIRRDILNEIRSLSFLTEDEESIWDDVKEKLEEIRPLLQSSRKTESSIPLLNENQT